MKDFINKIHITRLLIFLVVFTSIIILCAIESFLKGFMQFIKDILDYKPLSIIIIGTSLALGLFYSFSHKGSAKTQEISLFKVFGPLLDPPANSLGYGIAITSTLTLFKGIYNQLFFQVIYFKELDVIDITTILLACIPLLIWSVDGLLNFFIYTFIKNGLVTGTTQGILTTQDDTVPES